jgi:hypothetical protein
MIRRRIVPGRPRPVASPLLLGGATVTATRRAVEASITGS